MPSPQCGVTRLRWRSSTGSQPRWTSSHHRSLSWRHGRSLLVGIGPSVGTAPHATRPPPSRKRTRYPATSASCSLTGHRQHARDRRRAATRCRRRRSSARRRVATGSSVAIAPDSRSIAGSGAIGKPGVHQLAEPRLVEPHDLRRVRAAPSATAAAQRREVGAHGAARRRRRPCRRARRRGSAPTPSVTGPTNCHFTGPRRPRAAAVARNVRIAGEGVVGEIGGDRRRRGRARRRRRRCCRTGRA